MNYPIPSLAYVPASWQFAMKLRLCPLDLQCYGRDSEAHIPRCSLTLSGFIAVNALVRKRVSAISLVLRTGVLHMMLQHNCYFRGLQPNESTFSTEISDYRMKSFFMIYVLISFQFRSSNRAKAEQSELVIFYSSILLSAC